MNDRVVEAKVTMVRNFQVKDFIADRFHNKVMKVRVEANKVQVEKEKRIRKETDKINPDRKKVVGEIEDRIGIRVVNKNQV